MTTFKDELLDAHAATVKSISNILQLVPVDVELMNFTPHEKSRVLHELIQHAQQIELYFIRGIVRGEWNMDAVPWYVGKHQPMVDQLLANHREAMELLDSVSDADLLEKQVTLSYMEGTLAKMLLHNLDHMQHHRTQLFMYLKLLNVPVDSKTIWE